MKSIVRLAAIGAVGAALLGCVVAPVPPYGVEGARGFVHVAPVYPMPAPGYVWQVHATYGWGWHHPRYGWHRGWRRDGHRGRH